MEETASPRDRILDAAEYVFAAKGFRGGALNDVALATGYTRPGVLHYFASKAALLLGVLERRDSRLQVREGFSGARTVGDVLVLFARQIPQVLAQRHIVQLAHVLNAEAASADHPARDWVVERESRLRHEFAALVETSQELGELSPNLDPEVLAALFISAQEGLEGQWLLDDTVDVAAGMKLLMDMVSSYQREGERPQTPET